MTCVLVAVIPVAGHTEKSCVLQPPLYSTSKWMTLSTTVLLLTPIGASPDAHGSRESMQPASERASNAQRIPQT